MSDADEAVRGALLARASLRTAFGTILSRLTGLLRLVMVAYALGGRHVADAFNLANTTPNIVHDLVIGGVLAATFVPVFVERILRRPAEEAAESISAVVTISFLLLVAATVVFELAAPLVIDLYTFGSGSPEERRLAVELLRYFAPQLLGYGAISLIAGVLATRDRFAVVGLVPAVNNLIGIGVLALFASLDRTPSLTLVDHPGLVALLGLGTTAGVLAQAVALLPSLWRSGVRLHFRFRPRDPAIRTLVSLSGWTFGIVATNQAAVFVVLILAYHLAGGGSGAVSAYTYAYTFFQFPFAIAATSIVNVATPDLARAYAESAPSLVAARFGTAMRQLLAVILPATVGYLILAGPAITLALQHGAEQLGQAHLTGSVLALLAVGLPGYCVFFLCVRTFQAMQDTRSAFVCYALENALNVLVAILLYRRLGVQGLALSFSIAYAVGALVAIIVLRAHLGSIGGRQLLHYSARAFGLSVMMALVVALVSTATGTGSGLGGWLRLLLAVFVGMACYLGGAGAAGTLAASRSARARSGGSTGEGARGAHRRRHRQRK